MRRKVEVLEHIEPEHDGDALHRVIISELTLPFIIEAGHCIADAPSPELLGYRAAGRRHPLSTRGGREARGFDVYALPQQPTEVSPVGALGLLRVSRNDRLQFISITSHSLSN